MSLADLQKNRHSLAVCQHFRKMLLKPERFKALQKAFCPVGSDKANMRFILLRLLNHQVPNAQALKWAL